MKGSLCEKGNYQLFENDYGRRLLILDGRRWFAWVVENGNEKLYFTDNHHLDDYLMIREGVYFKTNVLDDPEYPNIPRLYLQHKDHYHEIILLEGLPNLLNIETNILATENIYDRHLVESCICV
ncbi:MAG TPA: hypothetical protein VIK89_01765 [Cytophagaceae bacterium]